MSAVMSDVSIYLPTLFAFLIAAATPGPATLAVSTTAMALGTRSAALLGFGLAVGLSFWGVIAAAGLGALLTQSITGLTVLRWVGGIYLLYLAWQAGRSACFRTKTVDAIETPSDTRLFIRGLLLNLSNPKAVLAWISILALGLESTSGDPSLAIITGLCAALGLVIYLFYACAFSLSSVRAGYRASQRVVEGVAAIFFGFTGLKLIASPPPT